MRSIILYSFFIVFILLSCEEKTTVSTTNTSNKLVQSDMATAANAWTNLFYRNQDWFGGDGVFSIPLNGKEYTKAMPNDSVLFLFSDTLIKLRGPIKNNQLKEEDYKMIHNSIGLMRGSEPSNGIVYHWKNTTSNEPKSVFSPINSSDSSASYFWLGDGFVNTDGDGKLYIFAYEIVDLDTDDIFNFEQIGVSILVIDYPYAFPYTDVREIKTDLMVPLSGMHGKTTFGNAILVNTSSADAPHPDGYIYIYGCIGFDKGLVVARVKPSDFAKTNSWSFWNGTAWQPQLTDAKPVTKHTANELSVSPLKNGKYILVTQENGVDPHVSVKVANSPIGPFYPAKSIWQCSEVREDIDYFAYNAKAHPSLSSNEELLISYHVNSFDFFEDILHDAHLYRPRFLNLKLE